MDFYSDYMTKYIEIPFSYIGDGNYFVLRYSGSSIDGINDGDIVIIKRQCYAEDNDIVVVDKNGNIILLKEFENNHHYTILGVAVKVLKDI